jgi:hypothetical protein
VAKGVIPDPMKRRHLVEDDLDPARALAIGEAYLAEGRVPEAIAFLEKADAGERLAALRDEAVEAGDVFVLRAAAAALGEEVEPETWTRVAEAADAAGKALYAHEARRQAQRG